MLSAVAIDSREPRDIQELNFGGVPKAITMLEHGDLHAATSDGAMLIIERKTPNDFLGSLKDERLFPQLAKLANTRIDDQIRGSLMRWPYLIITGEFYRDGDHVSVERRQTGWTWSALQGALLSIQEMGVFIIYGYDYEATVIRLAQRQRNKEMRIYPAKPPRILGTEAGLLAMLPGIGTDKAWPVLEYAGSAGFALQALTDDETKIPGIGSGIKRQVKNALGLLPGTKMVVIGTEE